MANLPIRLQRYAFYRCERGRKRLTAVYNVADEAAAWVALAKNFPDHEHKEWIVIHVGPATRGPEAA